MAGINPSLTGYMLRVGLGLALLALAGGGIVFFHRRRAPRSVKGAVGVLASLPLGRDVLFIVRLGPEVFALTTGNSGTRVISRWPYEEWKRFGDENSSP
jgi:hypothetical protein